MVEEKKREKEISEQIELLTELMKVKSSVSNNVTSDYTLAYLGKDEREFVTENYGNAEYAKELIERFAKKGYQYKFNDDKMDWERDENGFPKKFLLKEDEQARINKSAGRIFEFFMIQPHMIAILHRNRGENFLVKLLGKYQEEDKPVVFGQDDRSVLQKIKDRLNGNENEKFEED